MIKAVTVNIGAAGPERADRLLRWLADRNDDVVLLTEPSAGPGTTHLLRQFQQAGYTVVKLPDEGDRGAALLSRIRAVGHQPDFSQVSIPARVAAARLDTRPVTWWVSVYVPRRDRSEDKNTRKELFINSLLKAIEQLPADERAHLVIGGDYNVIGADHRPLHPGFLPYEFRLLEELHMEGLVDAYAHWAPGGQPYSWIGRTGEGYRYDYIHVGSELVNRIQRCAYLHDTREAKLTDHAAVELYLDMDADRLPCKPLRGHDPLALF